MDIHKCFTCSIGIYNMTTIVAILISFKDHLSHPNVRLNLNLVWGIGATWTFRIAWIIRFWYPIWLPWQLFWFFSKGIALQTIHVFQVILKHVGRHGANMGIETFWTRLIQVLTTETYKVLHWHLLVSWRSQRYETIHYKGDESFIVCMF